MSGLLLFFIALHFAAPSLAASSRALQKQLDTLIDNGGYILSRNNRVIIAHKPDTLFSPASIWKIATSAEALHILGRNYRFPTDFYLDSSNNLYIKGHGDPLLISEEISDIAVLFKENGLTSINNIYLDDTDFQLESRGSGAGTSLNPYDAADNALAVNFNTIFIDKKKDGSITSAEPQTPFLPLMLEKGRNLKPGRHRITIAHRGAESLRLAGELFRAILAQQDIRCSGTISPGKVPMNLVIFQRHYSIKLDEIIRQMLLYSNNFMANQLFLACGAKAEGIPATWEKGKKTLNNFLLDEIGLNKGNCRVEEGSGLSRKNKISLRAMLKVLDYFKDNRGLLERKNGLLLKSGTLSNVFSYAGYFSTPGNLDSFVIILNQNTNNRDKILSLITGHQFTGGHVPSGNGNH